MTGEQRDRPGGVRSSIHEDVHDRRRPQRGSARRPGRLMLEQIFAVGPAVKKFDFVGTATQYLHCSGTHSGPVPAMDIADAPLLGAMGTRDPTVGSPCRTCEQKKKLRVSYGFLGRL